MKTPLYLIAFLSWFYSGECAQPYFPSQLVFSTDDGLLVAIDEVNQRAYQTLNYSSTIQKISFAMKHFPFAIPDSPQSKYYVQLLLLSPSSLGCQYGTYWKYGAQNFNEFPTHWWTNASSFAIKNYMNFDFEMVHSKNSSLDEDYWHSSETCQLESGSIVPCQEIYFRKNSQVPLRSTEVVRHGLQVIQAVTKYQIISMGKPDDKYFDSIPKNWSINCLDANLGLLYYPEAIVIDLHRSSNVHISLTAPPHRINGNDTVRIRWKATECNDCLKWKPEEFYFNSTNFQQKQIVTITRVKDGPLITLFPIFNGGGYDPVPTDAYPVIIT